LSFVVIVPVVARVSSVVCVSVVVRWSASVRDSVKSGGSMLKSQFVLRCPGFCARVIFSCLRLSGGCTRCARTCNLLEASIYLYTIPPKHLRTSLLLCTVPILFPQQCHGERFHDLIRDAVSIFILPMSLLNGATIYCPLPRAFGVTSLTHETRLSCMYPSVRLPVHLAVRPCPTSTRNPP
jgi:hypothetical protein